MHKFGLNISAIFIFFLLLGKIVLPFGDEPDFTYRIGQINDKFESFLLSDNDQSAYIDISDIDDCDIEAHPTSLWATISQECIELNMQHFLRNMSRVFNGIPIQSTHLSKRIH